MTAQGALEPGVQVLAERALTDRIDRDRPVAVLFYADWCPYCEAFLPDFAELAPSAAIEAVAANLSHPEDPRWEQFGVETIPTIVAFEAGEETTRLEAQAGVGLTADQLASWLSKLDG